jgi:hypothetical protein
MQLSCEALGANNVAETDAAASYISASMSWQISDHHTKNVAVELDSQKRPCHQICLRYFRYAVHERYQRTG